MATIIDGKKIAEEVLLELKDKIDKLDKKPGLAVIIVGDNKASKIYVRKKEEACTKIGIYSEKHELEESTSEEKLIELIDELNNKDDIHGILVQLPLPGHINEDKVINAILPSKDVDGFHPVSIGKLFIGENRLVPCTPKGIMKLIESTGEEIEGKNAVVIGRSNIVGKPVALLLLQKNATVTVCHSKTENINEITKNADILVAAVGKPKLVTEDMVKEGAIVIDVGMNRTEEGLCGDVDFENVKEKCSFITPVPGGVGPMTVAMLMENCLECFEKSNIARC
jgi:methylenetetrahydrofolate dehydrogenase (NADP+)/methenyltetrahydrofolate cyclohydrolase|tara:strand:- start:12272 stop:13117 length:846 start_codon:yes stop_codon:yes gene_type:complete